MELAAPLLQKGGRLICYKAHVEQQELDHALGLQDKLGMELISDRIVALEDHQRRIICFEKTAKERIKLPRKTGLAQKRPL